MKKHLPAIRLILVVLLSGWLACMAQPFVHGNEKAVDLIINVFAILAGFLIAIMTLFSDMQFDQDANWRKLELARNLQEQRYLKHSWLFYTYLLVLVCVFMVVLLNHHPAYQNSALIIWCERAYLFCACVSLFYSFFLPSKLTQIQKERMKQLIEEKKPKSLR